MKIKQVLSISDIICMRSLDVTIITMFSHVTEDKTSKFLAELSSDYETCATHLQ